MPIFWSGLNLLTVCSVAEIHICVRSGLGSHPGDRPEVRVPQVHGAQQVLGHCLLEVDLPLRDIR